MELYGVPKNPLFLERIPRFPMTTDQKVWGSNPYGCTRKSSITKCIRAFFVLSIRKIPYDLSTFTVCTLYVLFDTQNTIHHIVYFIRF